MAEEYHLSLRASLPLLPSSNQGNLTKGRSRALWAVLDEPGSRLLSWRSYRQGGCHSTACPSLTPAFTPHFLNLRNRVSKLRKERKEHDSPPLLGTCATSYLQLQWLQGLHLGSDHLY